MGDNLSRRVIRRCELRFHGADELMYLWREVLQPGAVRLNEHPLHSVGRRCSDTVTAFCATLLASRHDARLVPAELSSLDALHGAHQGGVAARIAPERFLDVDHFDAVSEAKKIVVGSFVGVV